MVGLEDTRLLDALEHLDHVALAEVVVAADVEAALDALADLHDVALVVAHGVERAWEDGQSLRTTPTTKKERC